jgi:predicted nucleic acid-binding protein
VILYLETSNLVRLYVKESGTEDVKKSVAESEVVTTSIISYVEARAAFARKAREKALGPASYQAIKADLERDWGSLFALAITDNLVRRAAELSEKHGLRGYDAIHLSSALELKAALGGTAALVFSSADERLCETARREGLQ